METSAERPSTAPPPDQALPVGTHLGPVHLGITDEARALAFWTDVLGLTVLDRSADSISLGAGGPPLVALRPGASAPVRRGTTGLYHLALHFETRREFARALARLFAHRYPHAPTDHLATEATYLSDPDGNGIELTFETPHRGSLLYEDGQFFARTADGRRHSGRDPLDVKDVLAELEGDDLAAPLAGARIGHVHLHVTDLDAARHFYRDLIGFYGMLHMPSVQMSDFGIDAAVPHTLAVNTWAGANAQPPHPDSAGLRSFTLDLPPGDGLASLAARLAEAQWPYERGDDRLDVLDPSRNRLRVRTRDA